MANPYTQPTLTGYNASPPSNDGVEEAQNTANWTTQVIGKVGDPLKDYAQAIDANVLAAIAAVIAAPTVPRGYIDGMNVNLDTDADHDISISAGICKNADNDQNLTLSTALVKQIDSDWVEGTGLGGFPSALSIAADTWYHVFAIGKPDGTTDAGFDTSLTAVNLLADATEYTEYRRIWSVRTNASSNLRGFFANQGWMHWFDAVTEEDNTNPGTAAVTVTLNATPPDVSVMAQLTVDIEANATTFMEIAQSGTPTATSGEYYIRALRPTALTAQQNSIFQIWTSSQSIKYDLDVSDATTVVKILTQGYFDPRGTNA